MGRTEYPTSTSRAWCIALLGLCLPVLAANQPPVAHAGDDLLTASTGAPAYLIGDVSDAETPYDSLDILWRQIAGPFTSVIALPASATTKVSFPDSGVYLFELSVADGSMTARDTVAVRVRRHLPFVLLLPANGTPIERGKPYVIRWQMDPSIPCTVWFTVDAGFSWTMLTELGSVRDSFVWDVPATLTSGTQGRIKVHEYQNSPNEAAGLGQFVIVNEGSAIARDDRGAVRGAGVVGVAGQPSIFFSLCGRRLPALAGGAQPDVASSVAVNGNPGSGVWITSRSHHPSTRRTR